jgi:hypothetical protein
MRNYLFLIGIDKYSTLPLSNSVKDVTDLKAILCEKFDFNESDSYELLNERATNINIQDALGVYASKLKEDDNLIIYYSGHGGYTKKDGRGFWIPVDATDLYTTWISNETILESIRKMNCRHLFLISDSCFSNTILIHGQIKSNEDYEERPSRWALTSSFENSYDTGHCDENSLFGETIIKNLKESTSDFRVSLLIEYVKTQYLANIVQTPQGAPLKVEGHKGGEFIFRLKSVENILKGYKNFLNVLKLYKRNGQFTEIETFEDKSRKIGFQLYKEFDSVVKKATYYLYLYDGIIQIHTYEYLNKKYPELFKWKALIIFLPKDNTLLDLEKRKQNINKRFIPVNTFYIDEFIRESCTPSVFFNNDSSKFLNISNFVLPTFDQKGNQKDIEVDSYINEWLIKDSEPILVVKGTGGIGKTTFARYVADYAVKLAPKTSVLFIDSVQIKDTLLKRSKYSDKIGIYNFYEALIDNENPSDGKLSEELFRLNIDAGNILIIIDGLDEVISKIPNFLIDGFLQSIRESSNELGDGKVIITCRTHFWNMSEEFESEFKIIELKPFNKEQTKQFFEKSFDNDRKCKKAIKLADDFMLPGEANNGYFHPYILDIIRSIITTEQVDISLDLSTINSCLLKASIKNDYIIYRICDRERMRIGQIEVDEQVRFFIYLAYERSGLIQTSRFKQEIEIALGHHVDQVNIEAFKSHPFLINIESVTTFRYDFFIELFKSIYIANFFNYESSSNEPSNHFIDIICENCWFGSGINSEIVNRVNHWTEDDVLNVSDIINQISQNQAIEFKKKKLVIANLFNIALLINHKHVGNSIESNTELLRALFEKKERTIANLCIINLNSEKPIRFDFSKLIIEHGYIDSYSFFYQCVFEKDTTRFINCNILNVNKSTMSIILYKEMFVDCIYDRIFEDIMKESDSNTANNVSNAKIFLNSFFHLFFSNGRLGRQWEDEIIKPRFTGIDKYGFGYKNTINIMKENVVLIITNERGRNKFSINEKFQVDIVKFVQDGTISPIVSKLLQDITK